MKKTISIFVMAALCLFFNTLKSSAQPGKQPNALSNKQPDPKPNTNIQIGQKIPELTLKNIYNYKSPALNLADLDKKLIIIDFWATWCSPCITMIPKMDTLQKQFSQELQFLSVSYEDQAVVLPFLEKFEKYKNTHFQIPVMTNDNVLRKLFPHQTLPHYVWINAAGTVTAITGPEEITAANIQKMLNGEQLSLPEKKEVSIPYTTAKPLLINKNGGEGAELTYHSILTNYIEGIPGKSYVEKADNQHITRLTLINATILWLYKHAYGNGYRTYFQQNRIALEVKRPEDLTTNLTGMPYLDWLRKPEHGICYELKLPLALADQFYPMMKKDLEFLFPQYTACIERRKVKSMSLVRLSKNDKLKTTHPGEQPIEKFDRFGFTLQNSAIRSLMDRIQILYQQTSPVPFVDETGYTGRIDMTITANLNSAADMNKALKAYDLGWKETETEMNILVIRDSKKQ